VPGLRVSTTRNGSWLSITNQTTQPVIVFGYDHEPYLKITNRGVWGEHPLPGHLPQSRPSRRRHPERCHRVRATALANHRRRRRPRRRPQPPGVVGRHDRAGRPAHQPILQLRRGTDLKRPIRPQATLAGRPGPTPTPSASGQRVAGMVTDCSVRPGRPHVGSVRLRLNRGAGMAHCAPSDATTNRPKSASEQT
jgi:hypothetical protein